MGILRMDMIRVFVPLTSNVFFSARRHSSVISARICRICCSLRVMLCRLKLSGGTALAVKLARSKLKTVPCCPTMYSMMLSSSTSCWISSKTAASGALRT
jgi:hypothetical protein